MGAVVREVKGKGESAKLEGRGAEVRNQRLD